MNRRIKVNIFVIEGLHALVTSYFFSYLLFLFRDEFHFGNRENLAVGAFHGFIYIFASVYGGKFAQKRGLFTALKVGFGGMILALVFASQFPALLIQLVALAFWTIALCFTWPALEALVSDGESDENLPNMVGLYNLVWALSAGIGYFIGGALFEHLGKYSLYWLPVTVYLIILRMIFNLERQSKKLHEQSPTVAPHVHQPESSALTQPVSPQTFLRMAWVANPFAYIAINTVLAVIPDLARRFNLSPTWTGIFCSLWFFTRFASFFVLWRWTGWHYRFRYLACSFVALIAGFMLLLLARELWLVIVAQILFGAATGLIYYSSLFYSMDAGDAKGEHGGLHEAAIGLGICLGPATGASALYLFPRSLNVGTWAVAVLLTFGLAALMRLRFKKQP
jgi:predicted MFS family arabinose efflux permease